MKKTKIINGKYPRLLLCFLISCVAVFSRQTMAQISEEAGDKDIKAERASPRNVAEAVQAISDSHESLVPVDSLEHTSGSLTTDRDDYRFRSFKDNYTMTLELLNLSKPPARQVTDDKFQSRIVMGLRNPYYHIKDDIRVIGTFDFRFENSIYGITSITRVTLKYDLQRQLHNGDSRINFSVDTIALKFGIPF